MADMAARDVATSARRRRERQLRAWHRHVRTTVAMELATALHHSAQPVEAPREGVEYEKNIGLRAQKPPLPGKRPGLPPEPEPLGRAVTDGNVAAQTPLPVVPSTAGGDTIDGTTLWFFLEHCLRMKTLLLEEEERRKVEEKEQHSANSVLDCAYSWSYGVKVATFTRTWWETRVVLPSMLAGFAGYDAPRAVFPSFVALADEARGDSTGAVLVQGDMPVVIASGAFDRTAQKIVEIPQLPFFDKVVHISCRGAEADSRGPTVCRTTEFPLLLDTVIDVLVVQVVQLPRWFAVLGHAGAADAVLRIWTSL